MAKPTGVKAKAISSKTIKLTWKKVKNASGYVIYRYSAKSKTYKKIKTTAKASCKVTKLKSNTSYRFKVKAYAKLDGGIYYGSYSKRVKKKTKKSDPQKVVAKAKSKIGASYRAGGSGPKSFDCSGFVYWVYKNAKVDSKKKIQLPKKADTVSMEKIEEILSSAQSSSALISETDFNDLLEAIRSSGSQLTQTQIDQIKRTYKPYLTEEQYKQLEEALDQTSQMAA